MLKAGRAYHKYKVKRNCWPKTRGVAMNPVDHPRKSTASCGISHLAERRSTSNSPSQTVVVTTSTLVTPRPFPAMPSLVKKPVSLLLVVLVFCVVPCPRRKFNHDDPAPLPSCHICHRVHLQVVLYYRKRPSNHSPSFDPVTSIGAIIV